MVCKIKLINSFENETIDCDCEFVYKEYSSQPYGTCMVCGKTVLK